jgi:hypothetical protein
MSSVLDHVGQTRPGRLSEQAPLSETPAPVLVATGSPQQEVQKAIQSSKVVMFSKQVCPKCSKSKQVAVQARKEFAFSHIEVLKSKRTTALLLKSARAAPVKTPCSVCHALWPPALEVIECSCRC